MIQSLTDRTNTRGKCERGEIFVLTKLCTLYRVTELQLHAMQGDTPCFRLTDSIASTVYGASSKRSFFLRINYFKPTPPLHEACSAPFFALSLLLAPLGLA